MWTTVVLTVPGLDHCWVTERSTRSRTRHRCVIGASSGCRSLSSRRAGRRPTARLEETHRYRDGLSYFARHGLVGLPGDSGGITRVHTDAEKTRRSAGAQRSRPGSRAPTGRLGASSTARSGKAQPPSPGRRSKAEAAGLPHLGTRQAVKVSDLLGAWRGPRPNAVDYLGVRFVR
jgi:hypothetical protein